MIDASTGALTFENPPMTITPSLTRDAFLGGSLAEKATTHVANEPHHSWKLAGTYRSAGLDFLVALWFHGQQLKMVSLANADPQFGTSWDDFSLEKEMARKASHDAWLLNMLSATRTFSWGTVWSEYDERSSSSDITIRYTAE